MESDSAEEDIQRIDGEKGSDEEAVCYLSSAESPVTRPVLYAASRSCKSKRPSG